MKKLLIIGAVVAVSGLLFGPASADTKNAPSKRQERRMHKDDLKKARNNTIRQQKPDLKKEKTDKAAAR